MENRHIDEVISHTSIQVLGSRRRTSNLFAVVYLYEEPNNVDECEQPPKNVVPGVQHHRYRMIETLSF